MIYALCHFLIFASSHILLLPYFHISICPEFQASPIQAKDFSSNSLKYLFTKMLWGAVCIFTNSNSFKTKGNKILQSDGFKKRNHAHPHISIYPPIRLIYAIRSEGQHGTGGGRNGTIMRKGHWGFTNSQNSYLSAQPPVVALVTYISYVKSYLVMEMQFWGCITWKWKMFDVY